MDQNENSPNQSAPSRKYFTAEQKFKIVKEQLTTKTAVTEICKKYDIHATQFYRWQEQFFVGALANFESSKRASGVESQAQQKIEEQERELKRRQEVILELAAEVVTLKKTPGAFTLRK
jgi:transposase-like protein